VDTDLDQSASTATRVRRRRWRRYEAFAAIVVGVGGPFGVYEIRGLCWEGLLASIVIAAIALLVSRPSLSVWFTAMLVISVLGSIGLVGWSGWRFHSLNVFSSYSPRLTICGRDYQPAGPAHSQLPTSFNSLTHDVMGVTPSGSAILGDSCQTTVLFVESPGPKYQPYDLLGGP
jgi:hypothetical protein